MDTKYRNDTSDIFWGCARDKGCLKAYVLWGKSRGLCTHILTSRPLTPQHCGVETPEQGSHCVGCDPHAAIKHCCPKRKINPHMAVGKRERERASKERKRQTDTQRKTDQV